MFINIKKGVILVNIFLNKVFSLAVSALIASGKPHVARVINKLYVGITKLYKFIPSLPIILVNIILIIKPKNLVISEPIESIIVFLINLFFIILK